MKMLGQKQTLSIGCPGKGLWCCSCPLWVVPDYPAESANQAQVSASSVNRLQETPHEATNAGRESAGQCSEDQKASGPLLCGAHCSFRASSGPVTYIPLPFDKDVHSQFCGFMDQTAQFMTGRLRSYSNEPMVKDSISTKSQYHAKKCVFKREQ